MKPARFHPEAEAEFTLAVSFYDKERSGLGTEFVEAAELREFRAWFLNFDAEEWDRQIERDAAAGRLDALVEEALAEFRTGRTRSL